MAVPTFTSVAELVAHLEGLGSLPSVESPELTELDHGLQCAALLERDHPEDPELQVAGLVHDVAHPWDGRGQPNHARLGADAVRGVLGDRVAALVEGHVDAKRYLVAVDADYRMVLSADSVQTLVAQGGPLDGAGIAEFERRPDHGAMVALRRADELAKVPGAVVPGLGHWSPTLRSIAARHPTAT